MQRPGPAHLFRIGGFPHFGGKIRPVVAIEFAESADRIGAGFLACFVQRLKQAAADDFKGFDTACRRPRGLHPAEDLFKPLERILALFVADLSPGLRQRANHNRALDSGRGLGQRLDEGVEGIVFQPAQLPRESHDFIHENQAGRGIAQDWDQFFRTGIGARFF